MVEQLVDLNNLKASYKLKLSTAETIQHRSDLHKYRKNLGAALNSVRQMGEMKKILRNYQY